MLKTRKGYNLISWALTFTVLLSVLALIQVSLKRILHEKIKQTSNYVLWESWGNSAQTQPNDQNSRAKSLNSQQENRILHESRQGVVKNYLDPLQNSRAEQSVSSSVEKGSEDLLNTFDLNAALR